MISSHRFLVYFGFLVSYRSGFCLHLFYKTKSGWDDVKNFKIEKWLNLKNNILSSPRDGYCSRPMKPAAAAHPKTNLLT